MKRELLSYGTSPCLALVLLLAGLCAARSQDFATRLPSGVLPVWNLEKAYRETTPSRERVCLNGLWFWQPLVETSTNPPSGNWGYFKVPGAWPGITDYMQKDCQTVYAHPSWKEYRPREVTAAWYQRDFTVPAGWGDRRITFSGEYVNSLATVWIDGQMAGDIRFPGGEIEVTKFCRPGQKHTLSIAVLALPLKSVLLSYTDTFGAKQVRGTVERRGLCGDVFLLGTPVGPRITDVKVSTSVRKWEISFEAALRDLATDTGYELRAVVSGQGETNTFQSKSFGSTDLSNGRFAFTVPWKPQKLWDTHTPENMYQVSVSLHKGSSERLDTAHPERFGFREFWIDGRDFYLNGSRMWLCAVPLDNAQIGAAWASYAGARESLQRLKSFGVNFVYTHNYGCEPGTHLSFNEVLRAADDEGMLVSFSQPHFGQYDWKGADADQKNGYRTHAEYYVRAAQDHPSVVFYSMSHNSTGTEEAMNPYLIDGRQDARNQWAANNAKLALRAEVIVSALDPSRIVYHHSSGNLGSMHTANFYANFVPVQEMSDWFGHWATNGVKPVFLCEYGVPISWDWMMYRGWYRGVREFGSGRVPWELCMAEWNAQFLGDRAYELTGLEKDCLRWEAKQFRGGQLWHRWDYPRNAIESPDFEQRNEIFATYLTENIRAFRTWGVSAFCPWDHGIFWKLRDGLKRERRDLPVDWENLQRPGFSPDYIDDQMAWMNTAYKREDWMPTRAAHALYRNNLPLLAYLAGSPRDFTGKDHNFVAGQKVEKQLVIVNNSRNRVVAEVSWSVDLANRVTGHSLVTVEPGEQARVPVSFSIPAEAKPGPYVVSAQVKFNTGETQEDRFGIDVLPSSSTKYEPAAASAPAVPAAKIGLFDPKGETRLLLQRIGVQCADVQPGADLSVYAVLIIGKGALNPGAPEIDLLRVKQGLRVILFEQTAETLEQRFGFRVASYGLRNVFCRLADHPLLQGIGDQHLRDWRGEATLLPPQLEYTIGPRHAPEVKWCGMPVTRLWRAGNRGNVASVLIEKPARGDFMPIVDGGFGLQFSPLLVYSEGDGMVIFCQLDVSGRTETDPAAEILARNIVHFASTWKPRPNRDVIYAGDPKERLELERAGFDPESVNDVKLGRDQVLVVGPGGAKELAPFANAVGEFCLAGGKILFVGIDQAEANAVVPAKIQTQTAEHIGVSFGPQAHQSAFAGVSPADVLNRDPRPVPLVVSGATIIGNGVLAASTNATFCQLVPAWFAGSELGNLRRTYRRVSCLRTRLLCNLGGSSSVPLLERFKTPVQPGEKRWLEGFYMDQPQEWDDPYRFFCW